jgi:hypothetical protein
MEKKQTAVEWLQNNMPDIYLIIPIRLALEFHAKFQQALQMEREQIEEAYDEGKSYGIDVGCGRNPAYTNSETYYTQTFKP